MRGMGGGGAEGHTAISIQVIVYGGVGRRVTLLSVYR